MTRNIGTDAEIDQERLRQQTSHPSAPASGHELLYVISGSPHGGLFVQDSAGRHIGPFITGTSGGNLTLLKSIWNVDAPPASPSASDSEFNGGSNSVPTGFTEYDPGSILTVTESSTYKNVQLSHTTIAGTLDVAGIYKAIPAGDFTIWTKYHFYGQNVNYAFIGLCLWEDATDSSKKIAGYGLSPRNNTLLNNGLYLQTNYNTFNSATENNFNFIQSSGYLELRRNGSNYYLRYSNDGLSFFGGSSALNPGFTPVHFGVGMGNTTGVTLLGTFDFFRYVASDVGLNGILAGQLAGIYQ